MVSGHRTTRVWSPAFESPSNRRSTVKWMRYTAFGLGMAFGSVFLLFNLGTPIDHFPGLWESLPLLTGPVTLFFASVIGLKFEKTAGWWLITGAAATAFLFTARR